MSEAVEERGLMPKLRFPGFSEPWKRAQISSTLTILKGRGISKAEIAHDGVLPCIRYGELYTRYGNLIEDVLSRTNVPATELLLSVAGDVIIPSSGETKEDIATAACVLSSGVALGGDLSVLRGEPDGRWLSYYVNGCLKPAFAKVAQGDSVVHLYPDQIGRVFFAVPSKKEQQTIGQCLQSLDELLAAETEKLETLKRHKKGLLQQLFPAEGETTPRLRFPEFREEWRSSVVGAMIQDVTSGKSHNEVSGTSQLHGSTGVIGMTNAAPHSGEYILIARVGANAGFLTYIDSERFGATDNTLVMRVKGETSTRFLFFYLSNLDLNRMAFGSGQPLITGSQLRSLPISVPSFNEQQRIAEMLSGVDLMIAMTECSLFASRNHKQGLMQQLFPSLNGTEA